ncbi:MULTISPECIES: hypothetical protein [Lysobacter]|uniref:hypothetical protein n=1 Tax=Lysobacter TaxID=68 RepID=UPI001F30CA97|nr:MULTISPECIES: hypothetical protein [Lysobacter]UJB21499.1 hypothetical protein L1A79_10800 [Lysobacter capsici]UJQ29384.1 hypothetical protein L2D09_04065 [Lysobacter gummosus]
MPPSPTRSSRQLSTIVHASPFVMAQRLMDMALATQAPSGRDQREWNRMFSEKGSAAVEAWWAMVNAMWLAPMSSSAWTLWPNPWQYWTGLAHAGDRILAEGLKPVARTVSANRTRLTRRGSSRR